MDPAETAPAKPRRWRRRIILAGIALFALSLIALFTAPVILEPYVVVQVNESLREMLDAEGEIESIELSTLSGVAAGPARFRSRDGRFELAWKSLRSDATFAGALADDHWNLGQRLEVDGLLLRCSLPDRFHWPERWPDSIPVVLPAMMLRDATLVFERPGLRITLTDLRIRNETARFVAFGDDSVATDLERPTELFISAAVEAVVDGESLTAKMGISVELTPGIRTPRSQVIASIELYQVEGRVPLGVEDEDSELDALALEGAKVELGLSSSAFQAPEDGTWSLQTVLRELAGNCHFSTPGIRIGDTSARTVAFDGHLLKETVTLSACSQVNSGIMNAEGILSLPDGRWDGNVTVEGADTTPELVYLLARVSPIFVLAQGTPEEANCNVTANLRVRGPLEPSLADVQGRGTLEVSDGSLGIPVELEPLLKLFSRPEPKLRFAAYTQPIEIAAGTVRSPKYRWTMNQATFEVEGETSFDGDLRHSFRPLGGTPADTSGETKAPSWPSFLRLLQDPIALTGTVEEPNLELPGFLSKDGTLRRKGSELKRKGSELKRKLEEELRPKPGERGGD